MAPRVQRLVRRRPWTERFQAMLNPLDLWLWVSEEIQTLDWDSRSFGTRFGLAANFLFLLARANSGASASGDDVFGDGESDGWGTWLVNILVWALIPISILNAFYTMTRTRHYRLFEANVEGEGPATPSARRVRVDSSPVSSSPLRYFQDALGSESAESRAHPDKMRDVWEISVWDPYPATLQVMCFFSPGHVLVYMLFLPLLPLDPRPSVTVFKCLVLQVILSAQLLVLQQRFSQQAKDASIIQGQVMHEYDTKFVHPLMQPVVREAATQITTAGDGETIEHESVDIGRPATLIRRAFHIHPNQNYAKHFDPDGVGQFKATPEQTMARGPFMSPNMFTPSTKPRASDSFLLSQSRGSRQANPRQSLPSSSIRGPSALGASTSVSVSTSAGTVPSAPLPNAPTPAMANSSYLGVYSHSNSPLKKAISTGDMNGPFSIGSPRNSREMAAMEQRDLAERMVRQTSPVKDRGGTSSRGAATESGGTGIIPNSYYSAHSPSMLANARAGRWTQERYPTRRV